MKKVLIVYLSKKGTTKYFGHNIGNYLKENGIEPTVISMHDTDPEILNDFEYILLGCWTHGLFIMLQHPEKQWVKFAKKLPALKGKKVGLFTTYKLATGSMFKKMTLVLKDRIDIIDITIKSKNEDLSETHKLELDSFINN